MPEFHEIRVLRINTHYKVDSVRSHSVAEQGCELECEIAILDYGHPIVDNLNRVFPVEIRVLQI